jgi:protein-tyrosine-phosphatase
VEPVSDFEISAAKRFGIDINGKPQGLSSKLLMWQDLAVIVADNVPEEVLENKEVGKKTIVWGIKDTDKKDVRELDKIIKKIIKKVEEFVNELNKNLK